MPTTSYDDFTGGVSTIGARTDSAGTAVTDWASDEARMINHSLAEGFLTSGAFEVAADSPASMDVIVGSGTAKADLYVVEGDDDGQHPYVVRLDDASVTVTLDAADASNPRLDEIWLVVADATYDAGSVSLPRIGYRKGDAGASPSAPGADSSWKAAVKLATITVSAGATSVDSGDIADNRAGAEVAVPLPSSSWEVRQSTEVATYTLTASYANAASVSLSIPSDWDEWECEAHATYALNGTGTAGGGGEPSADIRMSIDGTAQQAQEDVTCPTSDIVSGALGGHRTGMTSTGTRTVALQMTVPAGGVDAQDIYLYARAIRTG